MVGPVRRTTIVTGDLDRSLWFYRDTLGLEVATDERIDDEGFGRLFGAPGSGARRVTLRTSGADRGMVSLLTFTDVDYDPRRVVRGALEGEPDFIVLLLTDSIRSTHENMRGEGIRIVCPPVEYGVPERTAVSGFTCHDPDGVLVALMRIGPLADDGTHARTLPSRRTTIVVSDVDRSLAFYRDTLGMSVFYDQEISSAGEARMLGVPGARVRLVSLMGGESVEGMVGLISFLSPPLKVRRIAEIVRPGPDVSLTFTVDDVETWHDRMCVGPEEVFCPPTTYEIAGGGRRDGMTCLDPDGVLVEFTSGPTVGS
jgi:catechol 2,3-dioxygenase-like lactoylglutathione lyase family enzyme